MKKRSLIHRNLAAKTASPVRGGLQCKVARWINEGSKLFTPYRPMQREVFSLFSESGGSNAVTCLTPNHPKYNASSHSPITPFSS